MKINISNFVHNDLPSAKSHRSAQDIVWEQKGGRSDASPERSVEGIREFVTITEREQMNSKKPQYHKQ